ncbi:MAG: YeeE/YedE family protein [Mangrovicoccus sp.]|nr:YeeE/YedE family protein [Mangrovicoccus sp.]
MTQGTDTAPLRAWRKTGPGAEIQPVVAATALIAMLGLSWHIAQTLSWGYSENFLMGGLLGFALYRAAFGFTGPWRNLILTQRGLGLRKTLAMLGAASITMMLLAAYGGYPQVIHNVSIALLLGAFLFGIGMQLGGGCGSGAAWVAGGGSAPVAVTLVFFIIGSVIGSIHAPSWWGSPVLGRFAMVETWGVWPAIMVTLCLLGLLWSVSVLIERRAHGALSDSAASDRPWALRAIFGPWQPMRGAMLVGVLAGLVLLVTNGPWGITFGYTIYGAKIATALGIDLSAINAPFTETAFWGQSWSQAVLAQPIWQNNAANMNIGIMLGAALAAALVGKWRPSLRGVPAKALLGAAIGGILMGYGARISTGCNIGAMMNGIASGSLHGWAWMAAAFAGSFLGIKLRPAFAISH